MLSLRKICLRLSMNTGTGLEYFFSLPLYKLIFLVKDYVEIIKDDNEARAAARKAVRRKK